MSTNFGCTHCGSRYIAHPGRCKNCDENAVIYDGKADEDAAIQKKQKKQNQEQKKETPCFVATAAFGDYNAPEVVFLRAYRDESLSQSTFGRTLTQAYYAFSPPLAAVISKSGLLRVIVRRFFLQPTIFLLRYFKR